MNRKLSRGFSLAASLALVLSLLPTVSASTTPAVEYVVGEPAVAVAPDAAFSSGKTYTGSHVSFSIGNADAGDTLSMASDEQASIEADKISVVGSKVYIGTGTEAVQIGSVNDTQNGQAGKSLVVDFASPLVNGSFEESASATDIPGWTVNKNVVLLGDLAAKTQGRLVSSSGSSAPFTVTGQDYSFQSDKNYRSGAQAFEALEGTMNPSYSGFNSAIEKNGLSNVLRLWFSGNLSSANPVNGTGQIVYQSAFGPEAWSDSFTAKQGDQISLDWRAANGGDDYEVYGFLYNIETEAYTEILYGRGRTQNWKTSSGEVPEDGTYKFRFVAGSYDASGGKALGASLYLDNIRVISGQHEATDAIIQQVIQKVTFENNRTGAGGTRTLTINAVASDQTAASSTVTLNVYDLYKVLYDGNGATSGTAPSDAGKYQTAQKASVLANSDLTKNGHAFTGWNTAADGSGMVYKEDDEMLIGSQHITLYAQWKRNDYNVYFDAAGGTSVEYQTVLYEDQAVKPQNPEKTGYTFSGWFEDSTLTDEWNFASDSVMDETTLYAKWTANPQTIQFDTDGGSAVSDLTVDYDAEITQPADPTKAGHTFKGWQFESAVWDFDKDVVKGDMTLTAKWEINEYTLSFNSNEGSAVENQKVIYNEKGAKPAVPEKTGYTFSGWFTEQSFENKWNFEEMTVVKDTTLYAKWEAIPYEVTFESNGGSSVESATVLYDQLITAPAAPERTGYTFAGWHKGETAWNFDQDLMTGDVTLHAKWTANPQTIQFDTDGGSAVSDLTVDYDAKITQPADPTKWGHTFKGWQFEGSVWDFEENIVKGNMTLMADWQINSYSLEFEPNGGSEEAAQTVVYNTHAAKPNDPVKTGYTFGGWFTDEDWENEWSFEENVMTKDTVLKAKWTINSYVVTFHANRGSDVEPATVVYQEKAEKPSNPTRPGYSFVGWYTDEQLRSAYDFEAPITADISLYARWSSNAVPLPPSEDIVVDIISDGKPLVQTPVKRTTNPDGKITDSVTFTAEKASEFVQKQGERAGIARIVIPDSEDKVAETTVNVPSGALDTLKTAGSSLEMDTVNARILVPSASIAAFDQNLYFRVVPVKEEAAQQEIEERARQDETTGGAVVSVLGRPMTIETNMQNRPVTLTLPLPVEATEEELENLSVFIEHSNGTKEVVSGTVVEWKSGQKAIQFSVNHFSTFTILSMEAALEEGTHEAYIHGFKDGTFRPDETVTRAQIAAMTVRNLEMTYNGKISYTDTKQSFAVKEIEMAREAGIILGFSDGSFRPDQAVTRGQVAVIASRFVHKMCSTSSDSALCETGTSLSFPDVEKDYWAAAEIQHAASVGIISGFGNGTFRAEQPITRAQAVVMLNRLFERGPLNGVEKPTFTDVPTSHWAFGQVEEGATTHIYTIDEQGNEWVQ